MIIWGYDSDFWSRWWWWPALLRRARSSQHSRAGPAPVLSCDEGQDTKTHTNPIALRSTESKPCELTLSTAAFSRYLLFDLCGREIRIDHIWLSDSVMGVEVLHFFPGAFYKGRVSTDLRSTGRKTTLDFRYYTACRKMAMGQGVKDNSEHNQQGTIDIESDSKRSWSRILSWSSAGGSALLFCLSKREDQNYDYMTELWLWIWNSFCPIHIWSVTN